MDARSGMVNIEGKDRRYLFNISMKLNLNENESNELIFRLFGFDRVRVDGRPAYKDDQYSSDFEDYKYPPTEYGDLLNHGGLFSIENISDDEEVKSLLFHKLELYKNPKVTPFPLIANKLSVNIKQIKFDILVDDIENKLHPKIIRGTLQSSRKPLFLVFDNQHSNDYRKSILGKARINVNEWEEYDNYNFNNIDINTKIAATRDFIQECRASKNRIGALQFIFWSLFASAVDKSDYDEKISLIADFAHLLDVDEKTLFDIIQVIKVICGEEEENFKFQTREVPDFFGGVLSLFNISGATMKIEGSEDQERIYWG